MIMHVEQTWSPMPRFIAIMPVALFVTFALLLAMAYMVHTDAVEIDPAPYPKIPPVVMEPPKPTSTATPRPKRVTPPEPLPPQPQPKWETPDRVATGPVKATYEKPDVPVTGYGDSLPFARVMAPPVYPHRAAARGVEGFVDLRFDVSASGVPQNIQVTYADPQGVFDRSAVDAVARWRFQPQMVDGKPAPFEGLSKRIRFTLER
jgi:protein TonB